MIEKTKAELIIYCKIFLEILDEELGTEETRKRFWAKCEEYYDTILKNLN